MGNVTFTFPQGKMWINRAWLKGFTAHPSINVMTLTGSVIHMEDTVGHFTWDLQVWENVFTPTSNTYSLDHIFDMSRCWFYASGVPTPNSDPCWLGFIHGEYEWRFGMSVIAFSATGLTVDFPVLPGYWRPLT